MSKRLLVAALAAAISIQGWAQAGKAPPGPQTALFAGGCFWSMEYAFEKVYGVIDAVAGYSGGRNSNPSYENYAENGHVETVRVVFDPARIGYADLVDAYMHHTDPTDPGGAFVDRGPQYRPIIYYSDESQRAIAEAAKASYDKSKVFKRPLAVQILPAPRFWPAEEYHQHYAMKNPAAYEFYRVGSGRDEFFARVWGKAALADPGAPPSAKDGRYRKPSASELRKLLSPMEYQVTQRQGTEPAGSGPLLNEHRAGIFVDIVSGEPLFSSRDKFESGTGWPSFTRPLVPTNVVIRLDSSLGMERDEVRSRYADSHLGHVFDDGPPPTGLRYCMDSAALRFVPLADMEAQGYGAWIKYVKD